MTRSISVGCNIRRSSSFASFWVILDGRTSFGSWTPVGQFSSPFLLFRRVSSSALIVKMDRLSVSISAFPAWKSDTCSPNWNMIACTLSIALNKLDAIALFFKPFPHSVSFDFQNSMLSIFHIHLSIGGHSATLVSGTMSTPVTSLLNRTVHQPDKTTLARDDCPLPFVVVSFLLSSNLATYSKRSLRLIVSFFMLNIKLLMTYWTICWSEHWLLIGKWIKCLWALVKVYSCGQANSSIFLSTQTLAPNCAKCHRIVILTSLQCLMSSTGWIENVKLHWGAKNWPFQHYGARRGRNDGYWIIYYYRGYWKPLEGFWGQMQQKSASSDSIMFATPLSLKLSWNPAQAVVQTQYNNWMDPHGLLSCFMSLTKMMSYQTER